jgi:hypothetical protein
MLFLVLCDVWRVLWPVQYRFVSCVIKIVQENRNRMGNCVIWAGYLKRQTSVESLMHTVVSCMWQLQPTAVVFINGVNGFALRMEMKCVLCEVRNEILCII